MDPRVKTPLPGLAKQFELARQVTAALGEVAAARRQADRLRAELQDLRKRAAPQGALAAAVEALDRKTAAVAGVAPATSPGNVGGESAPGDRASFLYLTSALAGLENVIESADVAPTPDAMAAFQSIQTVLRAALAQWAEVKGKDLPQLNEMLRAAGLPAISLERAAVPPP